MSATTQTYTSQAKTLHWLIALAVIAAIVLGFVMTSLPPGPEVGAYYVVHESLGVLVLVLTGARLLWRLYSPPPSPSASGPLWQGRAALFVHRLLYVLLFAQPLLGWAATSAYGVPIEVFGLFELPALLSHNEPLAMTLYGLHGAGGLTLCAILLLHVSAALYHHFVRKDETLRRMLPGM